MKVASRNGNSRRERVQGACHHGKCCAAGGKCVRSGMGQRKPMGVSGGCATGCAVQGGEEAGCEEGALGEHAAIAEERAVRMPCYRAARIRSLATSREAVGKLLGFRHTARRRLRRAVCGGVGSRGSLEPGAMGQRALRTPSPLLLRRESAVVGRGHGQRTRGDGGEGAPSAR